MAERARKATKAKKPAARKATAARAATPKRAVTPAAASKPAAPRAEATTAPSAKPPAAGVEVCPRCGTERFGPEERTRVDGRRTVRYTVLVCERGHTFARPRSR